MMNTARLPELKQAADNFDRSADFKIGLKDGKTIVCRLMSGRQHAFDGEFWAMQRSRMLKDSYTAEDRAWSARMQSMEPLLNGAIVKIEGEHYRLKVLGNYSDAATFEPLDRIKLEGRIGGFQ